MKWNRQCNLTKLTLILLLAVLAPGSGWNQTRTAVILSNPVFEGLTRISVTASQPLEGIDASSILITRPDGAVIPADKISVLQITGNRLTIGISADQFARITSEGTTLATRRFGSRAASRPVRVLRQGEPAANGRILGSSQWTDEGWNTSTTDPGFLDPGTGQRGLYRFSDLTPNRDDRQKPVEWRNGAITVPAHRVKNMLVLFLEFPDRRAADAGSPYDNIQAYLDFLQGASDWFKTSSYGQMVLRLHAPQLESRRGWLMMGKNAADYKWDGQTHNMFAYVGEACQKAYDQWDIKADDYDMLLVMPARGKAGLFNGPGNINRDPVDGEQPNTNLVAYVDRDKQPHYIDTALTAGNDLFRWGYRWLIHEAGHAFGFPDLYMYAASVKGTRVSSFFYCGGWDMMGNIAGHSTDFLAWHKWKLRWIRDDQVAVISQPTSNPATCFVTPVETPGGTKMVVVRTGLSTAYVAEFRTRLGVNTLDQRAKYAGVLIYRIDAAQWEARDVRPTAQIISRGYYRHPAVGGEKNLTGVWRPIDNTLTGYDSPDCCWQPGDVFADPAAGVTIRVEEITHNDVSNPSGSSYSDEDVAGITVTKTTASDLVKTVLLHNPRLKDLRTLTFETNIELQVRIPNSNAANRGTYTYVREGASLTPSSVVITKANGSVVPSAKILKVAVNASGVEITLGPGAFRSPADARGATVATRPFYFFGAGAATGIDISK